MRLISTIEEMRGFARQTRAAGKSLGFVPTMGALHEGHLSLVRQARSQCDAVVVSIFLNPTQFGPEEDLSRYPRDFDHDLQLLRRLKVAAAFAPTSDEMFPSGYETYVVPGETAAPWEGATRPGHFRGVATVVLKLLSIVQPDVAYFGQKDFQQAQVIRRMVEDLNLDTRLIICPIVRDPDGLALSSRNAYLNKEERQAALVLSQSLRRVQELAQSGETNAENLLNAMQQFFANEPRARLEYAAIVDSITLQPVAKASSGAVVLVAARVGPARLIDNLVLGPPGAKPEMLLQLALTTRTTASTHAHIPGLEADVLKTRIESCRDCAAISVIRLPPGEFLSKYIKRDYTDLGVVRIVIIARDAPLNAENFLYRQPDCANRFVTALYEMLGVRNFAEFRSRFALTDAVRCHSTSPHVPEKALAYCAKHLLEELRLFPNLETIIVLGEDAYLQFQKFILLRSTERIQPFAALLGEKGWAQEDVPLAPLGERGLRVFYGHHPTLGYQRSPSIAARLS
jgi:pantoate--beta-alanine ligase